MVTPEYLARVTDNMRIQKELEESILKDIARRIVKTGVITDTANYQAERLQDAGLVYNDVVKRIAEYSDKSESEIALLFEDAGTEIFNYPAPALQANGINPAAFRTMSPAMTKIWDAALTKTTTEAINLTKTTAVTAQSMYIQACDLAHMQVASGAFDYVTAIKNAIKFAAKQGVTVIYPSGHISSLDAAVRRAVLTGINQTAGRLQQMRAAEMDIDLMELSAHAGARTEHAAWQGRIVSLSGKRGYLTLDDIGYGDVRGFQGANCRHTWHLFFEGDARTYTEEDLQSMQNQTVTYNGEQIPEHKASQMQRNMERTIRKTKQELVMLDAGAKEADEAAAAKLKREFDRTAVKLKKQEAKLRDFCEQTGRRADNARVWSPGFDRSVSGKAVAANKRELQKRLDDDIIKEIKACGIRGKIQLAPEPIDVTSFTFDDTHINKERGHNVSRENAERYIREAKFSATKWDGRFVNYYTNTGATFIDTENNNIRTAFEAKEFTKNVRDAMEVLKKHGR